MYNDTYKKFTDAEIGESFKRPVLVSSINENTARNGKTFVKLGLKDGASEITATMFDISAAVLQSNGVMKDTVADVELNVNEFQGSKSFIANSIRPAADLSLTINDFTKLPPVDLDRMYSEICELITVSGDSLNGSVTPLSELALKILEDNKEHYMSSSAAISIHHNIKGGLLYHSYRMVKAADALCKVYSILDRELLICGAALHDIGKIWEFNTSAAGSAETAKPGVLFGHLYMGAALIKDYTKGMDYSKEKVQMLIHLILSHHGTQEFGAVACPATPEAFALHNIDELDARIYMCEDHFEKLAPGEFTEKKPFGIDNRLYKANYRK